VFLFWRASGFTGQAYVGLTLRAGGKMNLEYLYDNLEKAGVEFSEGLNDIEIIQIEEYHLFKFPPDYKDFLMGKMPITKGFYNWRDYKSTAIKEAFEWPLIGILFDIENNAFWADGWGEKPNSKDEREKVAKEQLQSFPKLIPIKGHRYIPCFPNEINNPVYSVYQTDIIYYGTNLENYLANEFSYYFRGPNQEYQIEQNEIKIIPKWHELIELNK